MMNLLKLLELQESILMDINYYCTTTRTELYIKPVELSGTIDNELRGFGAIPYFISGIEEGPYAGIALIDKNGQVIEFISYGGTITASEGIASGYQSVDIGVEESENTSSGHSLSRKGIGNKTDDFLWAGTEINSAGHINVNQTIQPLYEVELQINLTDNNGSNLFFTKMVEIEDNLPPTILLPTDTLFNFYLDATGRVPFNQNLLNHLKSISNDNCCVDTIILRIWDKQFSGEVTSIQDTGYVVDKSGNSNGFYFKISINDTIPPTAICINKMLYLDTNGFAEISSLDIDGGSSDFYLPLDFNTSQTIFNCQNIGNNSVSLTVTDANGNSSTCNSVITVKDTLAPTLVCDTTSLYFDEHGIINADTNQLVIINTDNCGNLPLTISQTTFNITDLQPITLPVWINEIHYDNTGGDVDEFIEIAGISGYQLAGYSLIFYNGNDGKSYKEVLLNGTIPNEKDGFGADSFGLSGIQNGPDGIALVDNQDKVIQFLSYEGSFEATDGPAQGLTSADINANESSSPLRYSLQLTGSGIPGENMVWNNPTPNSPGSLNDGQFPGFYTSKPVTINKTDISGNTATCLSTIYLYDTIPPETKCKNIDLYLATNGTAEIKPDTLDNGSTDINTPLTFFADKSLFDCSNTGINYVTLMVYDAAYNKSTCTSEVTIIDTIPPTAICRDISVSLNNNGTALINADTLDNGSTDGCIPLSFSANQTNFECSFMGDNTVTLTVTDANTNSSICTSVVTVNDTIAPLAKCRDITVYTDSSGFVQIEADTFDNNSTDACAPLSFSANQTSFSCNDIGIHPIVLTVTDGQSNSAHCTSTITVKDTISPVAMCCDITTYLDSSGTIQIKTDTFDNGSTDACLPLTFSASQTLFNCSEMGENPIVLTVTDNNSNSTTCLTTVTVIDTMSPQLDCLDTTIYLDNSGVAEINTSGIISFSSDNCNGLTFSPHKTTFNCNDLSTAQNYIWINEIHYDNSGTDVGEFVEIAGSSQIDLDSYQIQLINSNGFVYDRTNLSGVFMDEGDGYGTGAFSFSKAIQNGPADGLALINTIDSSVIEVLSYEGTFTVQEGIASGITSTDISVSEPGEAGQSLQRTGNPLFPNGFTWAGPLQNSPGVLNQNQLTINLGKKEIVVTAEDNSSNTKTCRSLVTVSDTVTPTIFCPADINVYFAETKSTIGVTDLTPVITSADNCGTTFITQNPDSFLLTANDPTKNIWFIASDPSGNKDSCLKQVSAIDTFPPVLACPGEYVVYFPQNSCAIDISGLDSLVQIAENCGLAGKIQQPESLQLTLANNTDTVWIVVEDLQGNKDSCSIKVTAYDTFPPIPRCQGATVYLDAAGQATIQSSVIDAGSSDSCGNILLFLSKTTFNCNDIQSVGNEYAWINEIHYDNDGTDAGEFVEIAGVAGLDLSGYSIVLYNGNGGVTYKTINCSGTIDNEENSYGTLSFIAAGIQNGPDGIALVDPLENIMEFISYEGTFTASEGPALGLTSTDIGESEPGTTETGFSLQKKGSGFKSSNFEWHAPTNDSPGTLNSGQTFISPNEVPVWLTALDDSGNKDSCQAIITIKDTIKPVFSAVSDIHLSIPPGICDTLLTYPTISATNNCGYAIQQISGEGAGSVLQPGFTSTEEYIAIDASGNTDTLAFTISITTYNAPPTINTIPNTTVFQNSVPIGINLSGISYGDDCTAQTVQTVTAEATNTILIPSVNVDYTLGQTTGKITLTIAPSLTGTSEITVTVTDDGGTDNGGINTTTETFTITVLPPTSPPYLITPIPDQVINWGELRQLRVCDYFGYPNPLLLSFITSQENGNQLANWMDCSEDGILTINSEFYDRDTSSIVVSASDSWGQKASDNFLVIIVDENLFTSSTTKNNKAKVRFFPNPTTGKIMVVTENIPEQTINITITSVNGTTLVTHELHSSQTGWIDLSDYASGIYVVKVRIEDSVYCGTIVLEK